MTAFRSGGRAEKMGTGELRNGKEGENGRKTRKRQEGETNNDTSVTGVALGS